MVARRLQDLYERHIAEAEELIMMQRGRIASLRNNGEDTKGAEKLLAMIEDVHQSFVARRARLTEIATEPLGGTE